MSSIRSLTNDELNQLSSAGSGVRLTGQQGLGRPGVFAFGRFSLFTQTKKHIPQRL